MVYWLHYTYILTFFYISYQILKLQEKESRRLVLQRTSSYPCCNSAKLTLYDVKVKLNRTTHPTRTTRENDRNFTEIYNFYLKWFSTYKGDFLLSVTASNSLQIIPAMNDRKVFIYGDLRIRQRKAFGNCVEHTLKLCRPAYSWRAYGNYLNFCGRHVHGKYRNVKTRK